MGYQYIETTPQGHLPAGTNVTALLELSDERLLYAVWNTYHHIQLYGDAERRYPQVDLAADIAAVADVSAAQALEANRRLVDLLTGRRWSVMRSAREAGLSWSAIGDALDMTKQGAADWYKRKIEQQEKYVPDFHDATRARAVLDE